MVEFYYLSHDILDVPFYITLIMIKGAKYLKYEAIIF
jgi:hypothetical protein